MAKKDGDLITVYKDGVSLDISPATLEAHKLKGWVVVEDEAKTYSEEQVKKMVDEAVEAALAGGKDAEPEQKPDEKPAGGKAGK